MTQALEKPGLSEDRVAVYHDRTWEQFKHIQAGLEGHPGVRLSFYEGVVEIFMPGHPHEILALLKSGMIWNEVPIIQPLFHPRNQQCRNFQDNYRLFAGSILF